MAKHGLFETAETLQQLLISEATGGHEENVDYGELRQALLSDPAVAAVAPRFVRTCRSTGQFWQFIKAKYGTYAERRTYIWAEFGPLMDYLERGSMAPADSIVTGALDKFDAEHIRAAWSKGIDRRGSDPEGAITSARTLIESVCKHILDESRKEYDDKDDLPKLYRHTAQVLNLAPSQHTEDVFRQILGGCTAVVEGLGTLRNRLSDAHGKGKVGARPLPRHAELAVNLSGALALYLLSTWEARDKSKLPAS